MKWHEPKSIYFTLNINVRFDETQSPCLPVTSVPKSTKMLMDTALFSNGDLNNSWLFHIIPYYSVKFNCANHRPGAFLSLATSLLAAGSQPRKVFGHRYCHYLLDFIHSNLLSLLWVVISRDVKQCRVSPRASCRLDLFPIAVIFPPFLPLRFCFTPLIFWSVSFLL